MVSSFQILKVYELLLRENDRHGVDPVLTYDHGHDLARMNLHVLHTDQLVRVADQLAVLHLYGHYAFVGVDVEHVVLFNEHFTSLHSTSLEPT